MSSNSAERDVLHVLLVLLVSSLVLVAGFLLLAWLPERAAVSAVNSPASPPPSGLEIQRLKNDIRTSGVQVLFGSGVLIGLYLTWRRIRAVELQAKAGELQAKSADNTQATGRFTEAIAQLGRRETVSLRVGGVCALERLAQESERDQGWVIEVLSTFIRERLLDRVEEKDPCYPLDVQLAWRVLGRLPDRPVGKELIPRALLEHVDLRRADLSGLDLRRARLPRADLTAAGLQNSKLQGADLAGATLTDVEAVGCQLCGSNLTGVNAGGARLRWADLTEARLEGAKLAYANLEGAILLRVEAPRVDLTAATLSKSNLDEGNLLGARLDGAIVRDGASLQRACLSHAKLLGASLSDAKLSGANLRNADLRWANLDGADLSGADLLDANLQGADLSQARGLTAEQIAVANTGSETLLPNHLS